MSLQRLQAPDRAALRRARSFGIGRARRRALRKLPEAAGRARPSGSPPGSTRAADRKEPVEETFEDGRRAVEVEAKREVAGAHQVFAAEITLGTHRFQRAPWVRISSSVRGSGISP